MDSGNEQDTEYAPTNEMVRGTWRRIFSFETAGSKTTFYFTRGGVFKETINRNTGPRLQRALQNDDWLFRITRKEAK